MADRLFVQQSVSLRPRSTHRCTLASIQNAELNAGLVRRDRHCSAERIDFLDEVPLADPADGRIAGHLAERLDAMR